MKTTEDYEKIHYGYVKFPFRGRLKQPIEHRKEALEQREDLWERPRSRKVLTDMLKRRIICRKEVKEYKTPSLKSFLKSDKEGALELMMLAGEVDERV